MVFVSQKKIRYLILTLFSFLVFVAYQNCSESFRTLLSEQSEISSTAKSMQPPRDIVSSDLSEKPYFSGINVGVLTWDGRVAIKSSIAPLAPPPSGLLGQFSYPFQMIGGESKTVGSHSLSLENSGNLILRNASSTIVWQSNSTGCVATNCKLRLQTDGNLVLSNTSTMPPTALWSTGVPPLVLVPSADRISVSMQIYNVPPFLGIARPTDGLLTYPQTFAWGLKTFRSESLDQLRPTLASAMGDALKQSFSPIYYWGYPLRTTNAPVGAEILQTNMINVGSLVPHPGYKINPYRSNSLGNADETGSFLTYKARWLTRFIPLDQIDSVGNNFVAVLPLTIIVKNPSSINSEVYSVRANASQFTLLQDTLGNPIQAIEPSLTFDGKLMVFQNWEVDNTRLGRLYYSFNPSVGAILNGWSVPKPISQMYNDPLLRKMYPLARYQIRDSIGNPLAQVKGAYPWISLDGDDVFFAATTHADGARRAGLSAVGASTKGLVKLIDGGMNFLRKGGFPKLSVSSFGRTPGRWSPLEFNQLRTLPLSDKLYTYPLMSTGVYSEASFEETIVGNYELYLDMTEGVSASGVYDTSLTQDSSGFFHAAIKNSGALYSEEAYPAICLEKSLTLPYATAGICDIKDPLSPASKLFSGNPIYFQGGGKLTAPHLSTVNGHEILKNATQLTLSFAVRPLGGGFTAMDLVKKANTFRSRIDNVGFVHFSINLVGGQTLSLRTVAPLLLDEWTALALTYNSIDGHYQIYKNGSIDSQGTSPHGALALSTASTADVVIGPDSTANANIICAIDQVGLSRVVRSSAEIQRQSGRFLPKGVSTILPLPLGLKDKDVKNDIFFKRNLDPRLVNLGKNLFFDVRLSSNNKNSCASCHNPASGFSEAIPLHDGLLAGAGGAPKLLRKTPSLFNLPFRESFFADGRAESLLDQAHSVLTNPDEMGTSLSVVVGRLQKSPHYQNLFNVAYSSQTAPITPINMLVALREFQFSLISGNTRFDKHRAGDLTALSALEKNGEALFFGKARCAECHSGSQFTDNAFHNLPFISSTNLAGVVDTGLARITGNPSDTGKFLTKSLRGIASTGPFLHGGTAPSIQSVVALYNTVGSVKLNAGVDDDFLAPISLNATELNELTAFILTLSGGEPTITPALIFDEPKIAKSFAKGSFILLAGQSAPLTDGTLTFQSDGNLVFYDLQNKALWSSQTKIAGCTAPLCRLEFLADGNLAIKNSNLVVWQTNTHLTQAKGETLQLRATSPYIKIHHATGSIVWSSSKDFQSLVLQSGQWALLDDPTSAQVRLQMQTDGNLVIYNGNTPLWQTSTLGKDCASIVCKAVFQNDGNFVVYAGTQALWHSKTHQKGHILRLRLTSPYVEIFDSLGMKVY